MNERNWRLIKYNLYYFGALGGLLLLFVIGVKWMVPSPLIQAVLKSSLEDVEIILRNETLKVKNGESSSFNVDALDNEGNTALIYAATIKPHPGIVKLLLDYGANPNTRGNHGLASIHIGAFYGYTEIVELLLQAGADPNDIAENKFTPMHNAALSVHNTSQVLTVLLKAGGSVSNVVQNGWNVLHILARRGNPSIISTVLDFVLNSNQQNPTTTTEPSTTTSTPTSTSTSSDSTPSSIVYHPYSVSPAEIVESALNQKDEEGNIPLLVALQFGNFRLAQLLLNPPYSSPSQSFNQFGQTPLHFCFIHLLNLFQLEEQNEFSGGDEQQQQKEEVLHQTGDIVDLTIIQEEVKRPEAEEEGNEKKEPEFVDKLIRSIDRSRIPSVINQIWTVVDQLLQLQQSSSTSSVLEVRGIDPVIPDPTSPSTVVCNDVDVNVNVAVGVKKCPRYTVLQWAVRLGTAKMVEKLLANGADSTVKTEDGKTLLDLARNRQMFQSPEGQLDGEREEVTEIIQLLTAQLDTTQTQQPQQQQHHKQVDTENVAVSVDEVVDNSKAPCM